MPKGKAYRYYVEPLDVHTNSVLAGKLAPRYDCEDRTFWTGRVSPAWEVPSRRFVNYLKRSKCELNIEFDAFIQEDNKPLRPFPWPIKKKPEYKKPCKKKAA